MAIGRDRPHLDQRYGEAEVKNVGLKGIATVAPMTPVIKLKWNHYSKTKIRWCNTAKQMGRGNWEELLV
jgi:hypothetical protein